MSRNNVSVDWIMSELAQVFISKYKINQIKDSLKSAPSASNTSYTKPQQIVTADSNSYLMAKIDTLQIGINVQKLFIMIIENE